MKREATVQLPGKHATALLLPDALEHKMKEEPMS